MKINRILKRQRTIKALTALSKSKFASLSESFENTYEAAILEKRDKEKKIRKLGGGRKSFVSEPGGKLLFILFYVKCYPTFDLAGAIFGVDAAQCCKWANKLLPILEKTLHQKVCLPQRRISTVEEFNQRFPEIKDVFLDATERPVQRSCNYAKQKRNYSGKKKMHTRKNQIICDENKRILVLSPSTNGKRHDKKVYDSEMNQIPDRITIFCDSGYQGIRESHSNTILPVKRAKKKPLKEEEKLENQLLSHFRVKVEHAIGGIKRMNTCAHKYRNRKGQDDSFVLISAGIWNYCLSSN